jgi:hypothetical protein
MTTDTLETKLTAVPLALSHRYSVCSDGRSIFLYRGPAHWSSHHLERDLSDAFVHLDLVPTPRLVVDAVLPAVQAFGDWFSPTHRVRLPAMARVPLAPTQRPPSVAEGEGSVTQRAPSRGIGAGVRRRTRYVRFVLLNYDSIVGLPIRYDDRSITRGRLRFSGHGWRVTLDEVHPGLDVFNRLNVDGGITTTHVGELARVDGEAFAPGDALGVLECLHYLCWFTRGSSCAVTLPVGFDRGDEAVWTQWQEAWVESYTTPPHWLDRIQGQSELEDLFPLFFSLWQNPTFNSSLRIALRSYVDANSPNPIQSALALGQLALESLAYTYLVAAGNDPDAFGRRVRANVTLRRLLELLAIPRGLPTPLRSLRSARPASWNRDPWDGPSAVTWLRNYAMHGERSQPGPTWRNWLDGWQLTCWYVEMVILALCGYRGTYASRIYMDALHGTVHRVPWVGRR